MILGEFEAIEFGGSYRALKWAAYVSLEARAMILDEFEDTEFGGPYRALKWATYVSLEARARARPDSGC
jgi:hypothetical protein